MNPYKNIIRIMLIIIILAFSVRFYYSAKDVMPSTDSIIYINIAENIISGKGFISDYLSMPWTNYTLPYSAKMFQPLMPAIISALFMTLGKSLMIAKLPSLILGTAIIYLIYLLGKELFNSKVGIIAAFIASLNPYLILNSSLAQTDITYTFFLTLAVFYYILFFKEKKRKYAIIFALSVSLAFWSRIQAIAVIILFILHYLIYKKRISFIFILVLLFTCLPWYIWITADIPIDEYLENSQRMSVSLENKEEYAEIMSIDFKPSFTRFTVASRALKDLFYDITKTSYYLLTPILYILCILGVFLIRWKKSMIILLIPIVATIIVPSHMFDICESIRFLIPAAPFLALLPACALYRLIKKKTALIVTIILISIIGFLQCGVPDSDRCFGMPIYPAINKEIGNALPKSIISSNKPLIAYTGSSRWIRLPYSHYNNTLRFLKQRNVSIIIISEEHHLDSMMRGALYSNMTFLDDYHLAHYDSFLKYKIYTTKNINLSIEKKESG